MKLLQLVSDGSCHAYHEELAEDQRFRVIAYVPGVNPQPDRFLTPAEIEAKVAESEPIAPNPEPEPEPEPVVMAALSDAPVFVSTGKRK